MEYVTRKEMHIRLALTAFRLPKGSTVRVEQFDNIYGKVLLRVGTDIDWICGSIMKNLDEKEGED